MRMWKNKKKTTAFSVKKEDYKLKEEVGHGASATVYRAIYLPLDKIVAVKCLDLDRCNSNLVCCFMPFSSSLLFFVLLILEPVVNCDFIYLFLFLIASLIYASMIIRRVPSSCLITCQFGSLMF